MRLKREASRGDEAAEDAARRLIGTVGERVRRMRHEKALSRRALADISGVSQRHLAQLESGDGNISIVLLHRIAGALGSQVAQLVGDMTHAESEDTLLNELFRRASAEQRRLALRILQRRQPCALPIRRICLIGLRGAGKSTLGRLLGSAMNLPFVELNQNIEALSGMAVDEVMALYGQEGYRRLEQQALDHIIKSDDAIVLAAAGGIVSDPATFQSLLDHFHTVWLKAAPQDHMNRVRAQGDERPMAGNPRAMQELNAILAAREQLYARTDTIINTSGRTVQDCLAEILRVVHSGDVPFDDASR